MLFSVLPKGNEARESARLMPRTTETERVVANRRRQLQRWIDDRHNGVKVSFIESTNDGTRQINQGEVSALLKTKSFGEKRARSLEVLAGMPTRYLESDLSPAEALARGGELSLHEPSQVTPTSRSRQIVWPFKLLSYSRLVELQKQLGPRRAGQFISELDHQLELVVLKWERDSDHQKSAAG